MRPIVLTPPSIPALVTSRAVRTLFRAGGCRVPPWTRRYRGPRKPSRGAPPVVRFSAFPHSMRRLASSWPIVISGLLATSATGHAAEVRRPVPVERGCGGADAPLTTTVDSAHDTVIISLGPCRVPALGAMDMGRMSGMAMMTHGPGHEDVRVH